VTHCTFHLTYFNIWRGTHQAGGPTGPPGKCQAARWPMQSAPAHHSSSVCEIDEILYSVHLNCVSAQIKPHDAATHSVWRKWSDGTGVTVTVIVMLWVDMNCAFLVAWIKQVWCFSLLLYLSVLKGYWCRRADKRLSDPVLWSFCSQKENGWLLRRLLVVHYFCRFRETVHVWVCLGWAGTCRIKLSPVSLLLA